MGYKPSKADFDFWIKDCGTHYEYLAVYVDDVLAFGKDPLRTIEELQTDYVLKGVGAPEYYLGGNVCELDDTWKAEHITTSLSASTYIKNAIAKYEAILGEFKEHNTPMVSDYHPELEDLELLGPKEHSLFWGLIGSANWMITLGRFDIAYATSKLV
jgi:hypothetical protein